MPWLPSSSQPSSRPSSPRVSPPCGRGLAARRLRLLRLRRLLCHSLNYSRMMSCRQSCGRQRPRFPRYPRGRGSNRAARPPGRRRAARTASSSAITSTSLKKRSTEGRKPAAVAERRTIVAARDSGTNLRPALADLAEQRLLRRFAAARAATRCRSARRVGGCTRHVLGDVLDALERRRQRLEVGRLTHRLQRFQLAPDRERHDVVLRRRVRQDGVDLVVAIAAPLEQIAQALDEERAQLVRPMSRSSASGGISPMRRSPPSPHRNDRPLPFRRSAWPG